MVLTAVRGALGFCSRLPVGRTEAAFRAFRATPAALPLAGYPVGALLAAPLLLPLPPATVAAAFAVWAYAVTGINHLDGAADVGDALAAHGTPAERRAAMRDTAVGAGGVLAVALVVGGLSLAGFALASLPRSALALVLAAEVGAKLGVAALACFGTASHDGLGSQLTERARPRSFPAAALAALPALALTWPRPAAAFAVVAAVVAAVVVLRWAAAALDGVGGDAFGAANELGRVVALHAGVVAWTLS